MALELESKYPFIFSIILFLFVIISSLISVAYFTMLERKFLGYIQIRKGPNKVGFLGILQPISDALKLFSKSMFFMENMNMSFSFLSPAFALILSIFIWPLTPLAKKGMIDTNFSILGFFIISSITVYAILLIGWSANSKYCFLGSIRSVAQMISYEVAFYFIVISVSLLSFSLAFSKLFMFQFPLPFIFLIFTFFIIWMTSCLAETNRSPFDFAEGESELVSGFNVEYMGGWFALIFLAEYLSMIILSFISSTLFLGKIYSFPCFLFMISMILFFIWIRGTFPRFRYDLLMNLNWKIFLPISISMFFLSLIFSFICS